MSRSRSETARRSSGTLSINVALNVTSLATCRGWDIERVAEAMDRHGTPVPMAAQVLMARGRRRVTVEELAGFAEVFAVDPWDLTRPPCVVCGGTPPAGFGCLECGRAYPRTGVRPPTPSRDSS